MGTRSRTSTADHAGYVFFFCDCEVCNSDRVQVFALVIGILGTISALVYGVAGIFVSYRNTSLGFPWEWILTILWAAVAGLFSSMYLHYHPLVDNGVHRERVAAGFDLANLLLWGLSAIAATAAFFMRSKRSLHTGRAKV